MFGSLKKKLSRRGSNPLATSKAASKPSSISANGLLTTPRGISPLTSGAPPTRRPDDQYSFLRSFDTIFLIDDSGSMAGRSWRETEKALKLITEICTKRDPDGIDIYFLNHPDSEFYKNVSHEDTIIEIFKSVRPGGGTPTGQRLNKILRPYVNKYLAAPEEDKPRPINIIVITDGEPSDDVESPIIMAAKKLDKVDAPAWQVGIQFFQVGREPGARAALKQLDDGLKEVSGDDDLRDIVDTVPFKGNDDEELTGEGVLKVVLGSVNRRLDRNSKELHRAR
ncbi:hypothetical protein BCR34DRAFT_498829 [Clohesyomyces aquaticus]|uniref:VWFA domain-containing protein n=1 Tax=Clohesyomyces aquaticus TaxID=1231657 RepID=A0A1Y1YAL2_9PLEO|nr:hypothetical protein BCR34DRAFT_498829 [Clohesyomyces aquaticus]